MKYINRHLTVDAGWCTGWAYWTKKTGLQPEPGIISAPVNKELDKLDKLDYCTVLFSDVVYSKDLKSCTIESLQLWAGSAKSQMAWQTEDNIYLCYLIGRYIQICRDLDILIYLLRPIDWKGTMNNKMVAKRVLRRNGIDYKPMFGQYWSHVTDAVGIGLSIIGAF